MVRTPIFSALAYLIEGRATTALKVGGVWKKLGTTHFPSYKQIYNFQILKSIKNIVSSLGGFPDRIGIRRNEKSL